VLTFLNMGLKTGAVEVISPEGINRIYLTSGEVVYARSKNPRLQLPSFLQTRGILGERESADLQRQAQAEDRPFRDLVIEAGRTDADEMEDLEKILYSEIAFESMAWRAGKFAFLTGRKPEGNVTVLNISVMNLLMEGARRADEALRPEQHPEVDRDLVATLVCATGRLEDQVVLTPAEWGVISLINGKRTLGELFTLSPNGSEQQSWEILQRLQSARLIQFHTRDVAEDKTERQSFDPGEPGATLMPAFTNQTAEIPKVTKNIRLDTDDIPTRPAYVPAIESTDVRLISGEEVTTSRGMYGLRTPARLVGNPDSLDPSAAFELVRPILTIGRAESNDIVLAHQSVSKQHGQLLQDGEGWRLIDLRSTNGCRVNGAKITEKRLKPGDQIQLGAFNFTFDAVRQPLTLG
jgi:pSer/pThr/pTyr-binding forkhead associated (FHA) protein